MLGTGEDSHCMIPLMHPPRTQKARTALHRKDHRLIKATPILDPIAEMLEAEPGKCDKVWDDLVREEAAIAVLQGLGKIPVEYGCERLNSFGDKGIDLQFSMRMQRLEWRGWKVQRRGEGALNILADCNNRYRPG